jgi:hypothetical protein
MPGIQTDTDRERERESVYNSAPLSFFLSQALLLFLLPSCSTFCSRGVKPTMLAEFLQQNEELSTLKRDPSFIVLC